MDFSIRELSMSRAEVGICFFKALALSYKSSIHKGRLYKPHFQINKWNWSFYFGVKNIFLTKVSTSLRNMFHKTCFICPFLLKNGILILGLYA
jgi:hypothetical protein